MENLKKFSEKLGEVSELTGLSLTLEESQMPAFYAWVNDIKSEGLNVDYDDTDTFYSVFDDKKKYYDVYIHNIYKAGISFIHVGDLLMRLKNLK